MALIGVKKRKVLSSKSLEQEKIVEMKLQIRILSDGHSTADFERLCYKNCPSLGMQSNKINALSGKALPFDMNRRSLVYRITATVNAMDRTTRTKINIFSVLLDLFRFCDTSEITDIFSVQAIKKYIETLVDKYHSGLKGKNLSQKQSTLVSFIKEFDSTLFSDLRSFLFEFPRDSQTVKPYTDIELKQLFEGLNQIYRCYSECLEKNLEPKSFPLNPDVQTNIRVVRASTNVDQWKCDLSRSAYFLTCFYTGINTSSLLSLKHDDISIDSFKLVTRGVYKLATVKGRQGGRVNYLDVGFSHKAKDFLKHWLNISKNLLVDENDYVFPQIVNGLAQKMTGGEAGALNAAFIKLNLPPLRNQRFRKTKASIIMRSTESIFAVAEGLNNSVETVNKYYADGNPTTTEFSLAAALDIRQRTAQGQQLQQAKEESAYKFKDPVREKYLTEIGLTAKSISNGLRCTTPFGEKAKQLKQMLIKSELALSTDNVACFKFLECFSCPFHAVIAEVQDVWLLLSFRDVISEALIRPSVNSSPSLQLSKVANAVEQILIAIEKSYSDIYTKAYKQYLESPHPLWTNSDDLDLLLGIYK